MGYVIVCRKGYLNRPRINSIHRFTKDIAEATSFTKLDDAHTLADKHGGDIYEKVGTGYRKVV